MDYFCSNLQKLESDSVYKVLSHLFRQYKTPEQIEYIINERMELKPVSIYNFALWTYGGEIEAVLALSDKVQVLQNRYQLWQNAG